MSAEGGPDQPKENWEKVRLLKNNAGQHWYRNSKREAVVFDEAAQDEMDRQKSDPDSPPSPGYPKFSERIGTEELPVTDPNELEQKKTNLAMLVNNLVGVSDEMRAHLHEELEAYQNDEDLEAIHTAINEYLDDKKKAERIAKHAEEAARRQANKSTQPKANSAGAASKAAPNEPPPDPTKTPDELYSETFSQTKEREARKRAVDKGKRDAVAELDAEEEAKKKLVPKKTPDEISAEVTEAELQRLRDIETVEAAKRAARETHNAEVEAKKPPPPPEKTPDEIRAEKEAAETLRLQNKEIEELAKKQAREKFEAQKEAKKTAEDARVFSAEKDYYKARYENLRVQGVIDETTAILAEDEVGHTATSEELKSRFDDELTGLERRLPENAPTPEAPINAIRTNAEFSQLTREAIDNIETLIEEGANPNSMYERYRRRFRTADLKYFDAELQRREASTGKSYGIDYGSMSPADRMRAKNPPPVLPAWAGNYLENTDGSRSWMAHRAEKYGDLKPLSIEEIRADKKKDQLFGEFMTAVDHNNTILQTIADGQPLDGAQRQLLEYCQYEFTYQYQRAEVLSEMLTPEFVGKLMQRDEFLRNVTVMYGTEKTQAFLKEDVFNIAVRDRGTFDRLALAAWRLNALGKETRGTRENIGREQTEMADVFADRLYDPTVQAAIQTEATGGANVGDALGGIHAIAASEVSPAKMQELFDRDKMKEKINGRGWDKWTGAEKQNYLSSWKPEEVLKSTQKKELGFFAQLKQAFMETAFTKSKQSVKAH